MHCWQTQPSNLCCAIISRVLLPLFALENMPWFPSTRSWINAFKNLRHLLLKSKSMHFMFWHAHIDWGRWGEQGTEGKGMCVCVCVCVLGVTLSLLSPFSPAFMHTLPVSGNTTILNGFPVLYNHPFHLHPHPNSPLSHLYLASPSSPCPSPLFSLESPFALCTFSSSH